MKRLRARRVAKANRQTTRQGAKKRIQPTMQSIKSKSIGRTTASTTAATTASIDLTGTLTKNYAACGWRLSCNDDLVSVKNNKKLNLISQELARLNQANPHAVEIPPTIDGIFLTSPSSQTAAGEFACLGTVPYSEEQQASIGSWRPLNSKELLYVEKLKAHFGNEDIYKMAIDTKINHLQWTKGKIASCFRIYTRMTR
jgi:Ribosome biogenesis protein Nop16